VTVSAHTGLPAPRVQLMLVAAGAKVEGQDATTAWFSVPGATVVVQATSETRVWVVGRDAKRAGQVARIVQSAVATEDGTFQLEQVRELAPDARGAGSHLVAAGWYPDPFDAGSVRFWAGSEWTAQARSG
jgi:hypothetical protein